MAVKPTRATDKHDPNCEVRRWFQDGPTRSEFGRSNITIECPFCHWGTVAYLWSLYGSGKRCENRDCGAFFSRYGQAYRLKPAATKNQDG